MGKKKVYIGVDIGSKGAVVALFDDGTFVGHTIPTVEEKILDTDLFKIFQSYSEYDMYICLEEVHAIFGSSAKATFSFGATFGKKLMIGAVVSYLYGATLDLVQPKKWQSEIWTVTDKIYKSGKKVDTKKTSLMAAKRLFPNETFLATSRCRTPHEGIVDAALIAQYAKLRFK